MANIVDNKVYDWIDLGANEITNLFLFGQNNTPTPKDLVSDKWIRPTESQATVLIDAVSYMEDGPGRFANPADSPMVKFFFMGSHQKFEATGSRKTITFDEIKNIVGTTSDGFSIQQYNYKDHIDDYSLRSYVHNTTNFGVSSNSVFVIEADGTRHIEKLFVKPFPDNFDFESDNIIAQLGNPFLKDAIDPSRIGRKVVMQFVNEDKIPLWKVGGSTYYGKDEFLKDSNFDKNTFSPTLLATDLPSAINGVVNNLQKDGVIGIRDDKDRPIIYATNESDVFDVEKFLNSVRCSTIRELAKNGVILVTGKGADTLSNAPVNSVVHGGEGADKYVVTADKLGAGKIPLTIADPSPEDRVSLGNTTITGTAKKVGDSWILNDYILKKSGSDLTISNNKIETIAVVQNFKSGDMGIVLDETSQQPAIPSTLPTMLEMTNLYLYGQKTTPANKVDGSLIRPKNATSKIDIDANDFMQNGAGRFALGAKFEVVKEFFAKGNDKRATDASTIKAKNDSFAETKLAA